MKPRAQSVAQPDRSGGGRKARDEHQPNEPLSGSKKVKNHNHVSHHNPEG